MWAFHKLHAYNHMPIAELVSYDPYTGIITRKFSKQPGGPIGSRADGPIDHTGYRRVLVGGKRYAAHRLAWFLTYGVWPPEQVDHINRIRTDNRLCNLRLATRVQNLGNAARSKRNSTGVKGVYLRKDNHQWESSITVGTKRFRLGYYPTLALATECRRFADEIAYGEFSCFE
jgi:HNH endonuclease